MSRALLALTSFQIGQTVRFVSKRGYHVRAGGDIGEVYAHFPAASNGGIEYWGINITDEQSPDGRSHVATIDELHNPSDEQLKTERAAPAGPRDGLPNDAGTGPYAGYSDSRLKETHGYWMSIIRAAKNPAQRERADRNCAAVAAEMRKRAGVQS